jgi:hypothetical protein
MKQICAIFLRMQNESRCYFIDEDIPENPMIAMNTSAAQAEYRSLDRCQNQMPPRGTSASHFLSSSIAEFYRWNSVVGSTSVDCD